MMGENASILTEFEDFLDEGLKVDLETILHKMLKHLTIHNLNRFFQFILVFRQWSLPTHSWQPLWTITLISTIGTSSPNSFVVALEACLRWMDGNLEWQMTTWKFWWQCGREVWKWRSRGGTTTVFVMRRKAFLLNKCERVKRTKYLQASKMLLC